MQIVEVQSWYSSQRGAGPDRLKSVGVRIYETIKSRGRYLVMELLGCDGVNPPLRNSIEEKEASDKQMRGRRTDGDGRLPSSDFFVGYFAA